MWLSDLRIVVPEGIIEHASLRIEDGKIAEIIEGSVPANNGAYMDNLTLIPGIIDLHGDMLKRDVQPRPNARFPISVEATLEARKLGMHVVMGAPNAYRGRSTSNNLSALDAIKEGMVDILATDYYPSSMLHTAFKLVYEDIMPLYESIKLISTNPADAMGYADRGRIMKGCNADLVLIEEGNYPRVRGTIRNGVPIYWDSHLAPLSQVSHLYHVPTQLGAR